MQVQHGVAVESARPTERHSSSKLAMHWRRVRVPVSNSEEEESSDIRKSSVGRMHAASHRASSGAPLHPFRFGESRRQLPRARRCPESKGLASSSTRVSFPYDAAELIFLCRRRPASVGAMESGDRNKHRRRRRDSLLMHRRCAPRRGLTPCSTLRMQRVTYVLGLIEIRPQVVFKQQTGDTLAMRPSLRQQLRHGGEQ
jgi:hypothetical protein|eukprot:9504161-Pyramimonas_sp.AAC.2